MTFDFQTLYTKIPDNNVLKVLCDLIDFCFEGGVIIHVTVTKYGASEFQEAFRKSVKFLLDNCFFFFLNLGQEGTSILQAFIWDLTLHHLRLNCSFINSKISGLRRQRGKTLKETQTISIY